MAQEMLTFMNATKLKANPSKTTFIMFGSTEESPIQVGDTMVEETTDTEFLGISFNKRLSWKAHLCKLEGELKKRIGVIRRLSWHLPRDLVIEMIEPLFMSKLRYAIELVVDITVPEDDQVFKKLHSLHRQAMKAALGIGPRAIICDKELFVRTKQYSVLYTATVATANMAYKCSRDWDNHPLTGDKIEHHFSGRDTRQAKKAFPPQKTKQSLINRLLQVWETLPESIKNEEDEKAAKKKIKEWAKSMSH